MNGNHLRIAIDDFEQPLKDLLFGFKFPAICYPNKVLDNLIRLACLSRKRNYLKPVRINKPYKNALIFSIRITSKFSQQKLVRINYFPSLHQ